MRRSLLTVALLLSTGASTAAKPSITFDIPPQLLSTALERLAKETKLQLLYPGDAVAGKRSAGLSGSYTPSQALEKLLRGSGLAFSYTGAHAVAIKPGKEKTPEPESKSAAPQAFVLDPVVVTASKIERNASEVPSTVAVIDDKQIQQMYNRDLTDVMQRAAGVDVTRSGTNGVGTINIRGLGDERTATLIDGQYANFLDPGIGNRSPIQTVDWDNVERVEIVRGAGSALYGPSAMGGVVNIITKDAPEEPNVTRPFFLVDSLPTFGGGFTTGGTVDKLGYFLDFKHQGSDGYKSSPDPAFFPNSSVTMLHSLKNGEWNKNQAGGRLKWSPSDRSELKLSFSYLDDHNNPFERPNTSMNGQFGRYSLDYSHWLRDDDQITVNLTYRDHKTDLTGDNYFYPIQRNILPRETLYEDAKKLSGEVRNRWDVAPGHTLLMGFYGSQDWAHRRTVSVPNNLLSDNPLNDIANYAFYGQYELALWDRLFVTLGGRGDWFEYDLSNPATGRSTREDFTVFNPRGGLRFKFTDEVSLRASVGTGFRPPAPYSLIGQQYGPYYEAKANPSLKPEYSNSFDLGVDITTGFGAKVSATGYFNELTDYMLTSIWVQGGKQYSQTQNLGKVHTYGAELEIQQKITQELGLFANYTHSLAEAASDSPAGVSGLPEKGRQLPMTPKHKSAFGLVYDSPRFSGRFEGRYVDSQFINGDTRNDSVYALRSYVTADFRFTYRHPLDAKQTLDFSAGVRNLFDRRYETRFPNVLAEPRVGFVQVGLKF
ncbi:MAG: TonB-dependent receptor [Methylococcaceae bacterium]|nr:TonB-dependent receptor [Methylococcaceae bacterium]